jgi:hypothetical protein
MGKPAVGFVSAGSEYRMPTTQNLIRVAVVEDDSRLRRTFTDILSSATDCECVGVFATGEQAMSRIPPLAPTSS